MRIHIKMISFSLLKEIKTRGVGDYPSTSIINLKLNIMSKTEIKWQNHARKLLVGKTISHVRYLTKKEMGDYWYKNPLLIEFTDGTAILSQSDDEGNDGGAYYYFGKKKQEVIPTL